MRSWLAAWAEFEALNALATYAFEHPADNQHYAWPELSALHPSAALPGPGPRPPASPRRHPQRHRSWGRTKAAPGLPHQWLQHGRQIHPPALHRHQRPSSPSPGPRSAPLPSASRRSPSAPRSPSPTRSPKGRSKFLAEVERLSATVQTSASAPLLFLVDEIFSGTNSEDRRTAAAAVLEKLLHNGAIGALSTHDLALTDLATPANGGLNVHMASPRPQRPPRLRLQAQTRSKHHHQRPRHHPHARPIGVSEPQQSAGNTRSPSGISQRTSQNPAS